MCQFLGDINLVGRSIISNFNNLESDFMPLIKMDIYVLISLTRKNCHVKFHHDFNSSSKILFDS